MIKISNPTDFSSKNILIATGVISGISTQLNSFLNYPHGEIILSDFLFRLAVAVIVFPILFLRVRNLIYKIINKSSLPQSVKELYPKYDAFTYLIFLLPIIGIVGVQLISAIVILMALVFLSSQVLLIYFLINKEQRQDIYSSVGWLSFLFLISGFAALIYQIVWQRSLFTAFGVNIESITIIVSIFMLGLGIGSIAGGILSKKFPLHLPQIFLILEILIGIFGIISLPIIKAVSDVTMRDSLLTMSLSIYVLLFFPTMLMGATLPILVTYLHKYYKNIGKSVGLLYFINTAGSAMACFITVDLIFLFFGKQTAVMIAALCNFIVGFFVYRYTRRNKEGRNKEGGLNRIQTEIISGSQDLKTKRKRRMIRFAFIMLLSGIAGYISLSQEILWFRVAAYATGGKPDVFGRVLGVFLFGLAFGSLLAKKICGSDKDYTIIFIAAMLSLSSVVYYLSIPLVGKLLNISESLGMLTLYLSVGILSFLVGGIFPAACHLGIKSNDSVGFSLSWIYLANILGATAGPLFTGFVLMNSYPIEQNILHITLITLLAAGIIWLFSSLSHLFKIIAISIIAVGFVGTIFMHDGLYSHILEKFHYKTVYRHKKPYKYLLQNRSGIIAVESSKTDIIYGGGVYDGRFNIDPVLNTNGITRAYLIAAIHPKPEDVLEIGLSSGSWSRVIANHSEVKKLTIVEINPGYLSLVKKYPDIAGILSDPKVTIHIDDGRRWLNRNPDRRFDLIVMNTTFHWRDGATNLLSEEFLYLCKRHLKRGGVVYYNKTFSEDVAFTAARVFKHIAVHFNFIAASDTPFEMTKNEKKQNLLKFMNGDKPIFDKNNPSLQHVLEELVSTDLSDKAEEIRTKKGLWYITDDNMATEFKRINNRHRLFDPEKAWINLFKK